MVCKGRGAPPTDILKATEGAPSPTWWSRLGGLSGLRRLPEMARDPLAFFTSLAQEQGPVASFDFALGRQWLLSDPDVIQTVFSANHDALGRDAAAMTLKPLFGEGLLTSDGAAWSRLRRLTGRLFRAQDLQHYGSHMAAIAASHPLEAGLIDLHPAMVSMSRRVILHTMFGSNARVARPIADAIDAFVVAHEREFFTPYRFLPPFLSTPARRQAQASRLEIEARLRPLVARRTSLDDERLDMLSRLVAARDRDGNPLTPDELRDTLVTLYFGGTDTSANALAFAGWLLALRPDVQDALAHERASVLGGRTAGVQDVRALKRHAAVLDEALRLYPPVWALGRRVLRSFEVNGHHVEAGDQLNASAWVVHRDPRWFSRPHLFRPERFWNEDSPPRPRMAFFPFGAGQRNCLGSHFARMEMVLVLATWLARRRLHPVPDRPMRPKPRVTLRPEDGAWVEVEVVA